MQTPSFLQKSLISLCLLATSSMFQPNRASAQAVFFPQQQQAGAASLSQSDGTLTLSNRLLNASFVNNDNRITFGGCPELGLKSGSEIFTITLGDGTTTVPASEMTVTEWGHTALTGNPDATVASEKLDGQSIYARLTYGDLEFDWKAILRDGSHYIRTTLAITANDDVEMHNIIPMSYTIPAELAPAVVGNTRGAILASDRLFAGLETPTGINSVERMPPDNSDLRSIQGLWSRHTTLLQGKTWEISSVIGLIAPGQARRSVLAYSERERAVPWRAFPIYNSWYELNIDRNNSPDYAAHMTSDECVDVVNHWRTNLYDKHGANIKSFVWDDGWDEYGTWTFNKNFPDGFREPNDAAAAINSGTGTWLGPVGGYGNSGELRRGFWAEKGGMQLSNPAYYKVFLDACRNMVDNYDFNFFKLDGISAQFSSVGPDDGTTGEENAEGIIDILTQVRKIRPDMFFNTTVGTWASPFWFHFTDAVWRQEADWATIGDQGDDRERWITYRDRLVYQNFVRNSPLCPINTLMTHGFILTEKGDVSKTMNYEGIVREMRCAFACGSGMVELYCDAKLLNSINNGALWADLAECIKWQEKNADVLPDIHWVGGNPWDGSKANVYGWASWNGTKATLALRNPSASTATFTFTLREALDIPAYDNTPVSFTPAFEVQNELNGFATYAPISPDTRLTVTLPASSVFVFDGSAERTR